MFNRRKQKRTPEDARGRKVHRRSFDVDETKSRHQTDTWRNSADESTRYNSSRYSNGDTKPRSRTRFHSSGDGEELHNLDRKYNTLDYGATRGRRVRRTSSGNSADYFAALSGRNQSLSIDRRRHFRYDSTPELGSMDGHSYTRSSMDGHRYKRSPSPTPTTGSNESYNSRRQNFGYIAAFKVTTDRFLE